MPSQMITLYRLSLGLVAAGLIASPALAAEGPALCKGEFRTIDGAAWVRTTLLNGAPVSTTAEFMPAFHNTIAAVAPARIPDVAKAGGAEPNSGAFPAAKFYYQYLTRADGRHDLPAYRLLLEVPVFAGGETMPAFFKVRIGDWVGGKLVIKTDISGIVGLPDVPIYGVDLEIHAFDGRPADADGAALETALRGADHADIEIHEGSADGPLRIQGAIQLAGNRDRLLAVAGALNAVADKVKAGACAADD